MKPCIKTLIGTMVIYYWNITEVVKMGNRAVLCLRDNKQQRFSQQAVGIYVHWNGGEESIAGFLQSTREVMGDRLGDVSYAKARLIERIALFFGGNLSVGVDICKNLDCDNWNNGVYVIDCGTMTVTSRKYND